MADAARSLAVVTLSVLLLASTGCAGTLVSQVVDADTGQPLEGAVVVGVWTRLAGFPGLQHHELVAVTETETDAEGRFKLEVPSTYPIGEDDEAITIYKFGFVAWSNLFVFPTSVRRPDQRVPPRIRLERFSPHQSRERHRMFINNATHAGFYGQERIPKFTNAIRLEQIAR